MKQKPFTFKRNDTSIEPDIPFPELYKNFWEGLNNLSFHTESNKDSEDIEQEIDK